MSAPVAKGRRPDLHERFDRHEVTTAGSDRSFGLVIGGAFVIFGLWPVVSANSPRGWSLVLGGVFIVLAVVRPRLLARLNRAWTRLGVALHRVMSPVVLGLVFYTTLTPIGLVLRVLGKDLLRLERDPSLPTYWIARVPPGPAPDTMRRQF